MSLQFFANAIIVLVLAILSGLGDSQGFVHAALVWKKGNIVWEEVLRSSIGFAFGIVVYWLAVRFLNQIGDFPTELQALGWFAVTIVGVAVSTGSFGNWPTIDKIVSALVLIGVGWLLFRTGG